MTASPVYFVHNAIWHIPPDQKANANTMTRVVFAKEAAKSEFVNALIYKLQKKKNIESGSQSNMVSISTEDM
jgi:hypothetical protein